MAKIWRNKRGKPYIVEEFIVAAGENDPRRCTCHPKINHQDYYARHASKIKPVAQGVSQLMQKCCI